MGETSDLEPPVRSLSEEGDYEWKRKLSLLCSGQEDRISAT